MSGLFDESPAPASNAAEFTVSEISFALKRTVEDAFGNVRVRGEISGYRGPHSSGHAYFAMKDDRSRIEAVIWKGTFGKLKFRPEEGMEVIAQGRLTTYPGSSKYQIVIDSLEPAGAGALMALLEERRRRLAAEGLFDAERKRPLPFLPQVIGVVTSPTGAVIRDIVHRVSDRFPMHVLVWPVRVQGETVGAEVSNAIAGFNALTPEGAIPRPDVLIVARGGGSLEDLWGFNDEAIVRAVAASAIPVIAAVGHETDWTLIDHAADRRAPTPTGAAEMAVPVRAELDAALAGLAARLSGCVTRHLDRKRQSVRAAVRALPSPDQILALPRRRFDEAAGRLERGLATGIGHRRTRLGVLRLSPAALARRIDVSGRTLESLGRRIAAAGDRAGREKAQALARAAVRLDLSSLDRRLSSGRDRLDAALRRSDRAVDARLTGDARHFGQVARLLDTVSYTSILARGFALVRDSQDRPVKRAADLHAGEQVSLQFADSASAAIILDAARGTVEKPRPAGRPRRPATDQGSLF